MAEQQRIVSGSFALMRLAPWRGVLRCVVAAHHPHAINCSSAHTIAGKPMCQSVVAIWLCLAATLLPASAMLSPAFANESECAAGKRLSHTFSSGASWSLCVHANDSHGLEVNAVHYQAPGDRLRSVVDTLHASQILMHYHDESTARPQLGNTQLAGRLLPMNSRNCDGELLLERDGNHDVCSRIEDNRILAKYAQRPALQSQRWELTSAVQRDALVWATSVSFTEDGQITPAVSLSGRARQSNSGTSFDSILPTSNQSLSRATVLGTWRMVFNLDDGATDAVQQFDFPLLSSQGNQRPMQVTQLDTETFAHVVRDQFRGWRIMDSTGTGYYLDPSNSGFSFTGGEHDWTGFAIALTRLEPCERYASANHETDNTQGATDSMSMAGHTGAVPNTDCGDTLDDFVNGEAMEGSHPVLWYSQSRTFNPTDEHWPVISNFHQSFTLQPFDWTQASPFEVAQ